MAVGEHLSAALPYTAASDIKPHAVVIADTVSDRAVVPVASGGSEPRGIVGPATALQGEAVTVYIPESVVEAVAGASIGAGANVGAGASGLAVAASGSFRLGVSQESASLGEKFSVYVNPRKLPL